MCYIGSPAQKKCSDVRIIQLEWCYDHRYLAMNLAAQQKKQCHLGGPPHTKTIEFIEKLS